MRRLYIAGSSKKIETVRYFMNRARMSGFIITYDWTVDVVQKGGTNPVNLSDDQRRDCAYKDIAGIQAANIIWCLGSSHISRGVHVELGAALATKPTIHIVWSGPRHSIFAWCADEYHEQHNQALQSIIKHKEQANGNV